MSGYLTIARDAQAEIEVKRSRFLCTLQRVEEEAAARAVVERLRREHWDARHTCSAFVLGPRGEVERSSDDGEPAGTAGAPMLEVLRGASGEGVSDVVAVVTRWFGGTLLGAGGLVRAYGDAVRAALAGAGCSGGSCCTSTSWSCRTRTRADWRASSGSGACRSSTRGTPSRSPCASGCGTPQRWLGRWRS